ncbi:hypothetical protein PIB30_069164 [Stylosanthes scabra]|uniref:Uncharacterized protein n=1 Tax=Stylosanthes scabra TaxID=79078 RepID=A0ABU6QP47_9FABA|nr:hypothetical protein [Stylosanthes scabra]
MALVLTPGMILQPQNTTTAFVEQSVSIGDDRAHPVANLISKQPLILGKNLADQRQVMEHWSTGLGKGHNMGTSSMKRRHPLAEPDMNDAERARQRTYLESNGTRCVITNASARKHPRYQLVHRNKPICIKGQGH